MVSKSKKPDQTIGIIYSWRRHPGNCQQCLISCKSLALERLHPTCYRRDPSQMPINKLYLAPFSWYVLGNINK